MRLVDPNDIKKHQALPVKIVGNVLTIAMVDPTDKTAFDEICSAAGYDDPDDGKFTAIAKQCTLEDFNKEYSNFFEPQDDGLPPPPPYRIPRGQSGRPPGQ